MWRSMAFVFCGALVGWRLALAPTKVVEDKTSARPLPTPQQLRMLAALDQPCEFDFHKQPLQEVVRFLTRKHGIGIELDGLALSSTGIGGETPITCTLQGVTLRSGLRLMLGELELSYVMNDGYLLVTSQDEAENKLHLRVYPVGDLVTTDSEFRSPLDPGGKDGADFNDLIEAITCTIMPTTWDQVGGPASITGSEHSRGLAIAHTDEAHEQIAALLAALRTVRDRQIAAANSPRRFWQEASDANDDGNLEVRVYRFFEKPPPAGMGVPAAEAETAEGRDPAAEAAAAARLEAWTRIIAKMAPELIAPESWEPAGEGRIRAESGTIFIRQTPDVQYQAGRLICKMLQPDVNFMWYPQRPYYGCTAPVRLSMPPVKVKWPQAAEPPPGRAEARILAALDEPCDLDLVDQPLSEVLAELRERYRISIRLGDKALEEARVPSDAPITRTFRGLALKTALELMLDELELTYILYNEVLLITTKEDAENFQIAKVYPVFDLVVRPQGAASRTPALDFPSLIESITGSLAPTSWEEVGGPGSVVSFTNSGALVISQTSAIHQEIAAFLQGLREVAAAAK